MDIPLSGALFITNPRRRNKRRSSVARPNTRYKNTIIMRHTGMSRAQVQRLKSKKGKTDERYKRDLAKYNRLFKEAGGEKARVAHRDSRPARIKQFKRVISAPTERKAKSMKRNPRRKKSAWQRYLKAASGKGYSLAELRAGYRTLVRRHGSNAAKIVADAKKFKPKRGAALKKRKSVKRKSASKAPARLGFSLSRVQRVVRKKNKNGVYQYFAVLGRSGTVMKRISKATYNMLRAKGIGARGKTLKKRRGTRKGMVRKTARRAYMKKRPAKRSSAARGRSRAKVTAKRAKRARPVGGYRRIRTKRGMRYMKDGKFISKAAYNRAMPAGLRRNRKNPGRRGFGALALRKNSRMRKNPGVLGGALNLFDRSANMLARVPVVGRLAPYLPTAGVFASVAAIHYYAMRYLGPKLPELAEKAGDLIGQGEYGYKVGTMAQKAGYTIGGLAVAGLLGVGTSRFPKLFPSRAASMTFATAAVGTGVFLDVMDYLRGQDTPDEFMAGEDMDPMLGQQPTLSGLAYTSGALNGVAYTGGNLNGLAMKDGGDLVAAYAGAHLGDAMHSGPDFAPIESQCLMMGPAAYEARFGLPAARGFVNRMGMSPMAGRPGHRWGWLVKMIGFQRAAKVAAMSPKKRMAVIARLRAQAKQAVDQSHYGALAYKGGELNGAHMNGAHLNGAHMNGAHMNGLAYTSGALNGVAYTGGVI